MANNTVDFLTKIQFDDYIKNFSSRKLHEDKYGVFNLSLDNESMFRVYRDNFIKHRGLFVKDILTTSDISNGSYLFPEILFMDRNRLLGYKIKYFNNVLFDKYGNSLDVDKLEEAYYKLEEDTDKLSDNNIYLSNTNGLIYYNGNRFGIVDTTSYIKDPVNTSRILEFESLKDANREEILYGLVNELSSFSGDIEIKNIGNDEELFNYIKSEHGKVLTRKK